MLIKLHNELAAGAEIKLEKFVNGENASLRGAFSQSQEITFVARAPRVFGVRDVVLRFRRDGEGDRDFAFTPDGYGSFVLKLPLENFGEGLYWYSVLFLRGEDTLFSDSIDNVNFNLTKNEGARFRLLVHDDEYNTPDWFKGGVMYQIFPDRFFSSGKGERREDGEYEEDWYAPISQYGTHPGADVKNNLFYGGDLYGVCEKLSYLESLGVTVIYLNPVFKAYSNHKYDTGDYKSVDEGFGGDRALQTLIEEAEKRGIRVILDGVFNHTGDDSVYFDRYGKYSEEGAYKNPRSKYRKWYHFGVCEEDYLTWWGVRILPKLNHREESCRRFFTGAEGIGAMYAERGIGGWRLDVADELSDSFLDEFRTAVKNANPDAIIIGEVWENAADKIAYEKRRRYFRGKQLDSVMNYPFRAAIIEFALKGDGEFLARTLTEIYASYPKFVSDSLMNIIGTHDTDRILTVLGDKKYREMSNTALSTHVMSETERKQAVSLLKMCATVQYTVYGVPSLYYGDEAGVEGGRDPFCRRTYPWGRENGELLEHYRRLGELRRDPVFAKGDFAVVESGEGYIIYERNEGERKICIAANAKTKPIRVSFSGKDMLSGRSFDGIVPPYSACVVDCSEK